MIRPRGQIHGPYGSHGNANATEVMSRRSFVPGDLIVRTVEYRAQLKHADVLINEIGIVITSSLTKYGGDVLTFIPSRGITYVWANNWDLLDNFL